jgi:hypothetical protein
MHSTNYFNTFIEVAEDFKSDESREPAIGGKGKSISKKTGQ